MFQQCIAFLMGLGSYRIQMNQYLEINCQDIVLLKDNKNISVTVKGKIKMCLNGEVKDKVVLVNKQLLTQKEAKYAQMFKSEVIYPPPLPPPQVVPLQNQPQNRPNTDLASNIGNQQHDNLKNEQPKGATNVMIGQRNIFGRNYLPSDQQIQSLSDAHQKQKESFYQSNQPANEWRNSNFAYQTQQRNTNQNIFMSSQNTYNTGGQTSSTNFFTSSSQNDGPSLFATNTSNHTPSETSNNNRRNNRKGPTRIS